MLRCLRNLTMRMPFPTLARTIGRRFRRDEHGSTAIEFAMIAAPFLAMLFAILETAMIFFAGQSMESGVERAARMIRTGQAAAFTEAGFKIEVCKNMPVMFDCTGGMILDVRTYDAFGSVDLARPVDDDGNLNVNPQFDPGQGGDIVVVRAFYEWPTIVNFLGFSLADLPSGNRLLSSTSAFRNEPF